MIAVSKNIRSALSLSAVSLLILFGSWSSRLAEAENWPCWRGPRGDGSSLEKNLPEHWNGPSGENIAWKVEIPGTGHASPIVWDDRVFVVSCREESEDRILLCLDRASGRKLWERVVLHAPLERKNPLNSYASSTPATDGKLVYVTFFESDPKAPVNTVGTKYANQPASVGWMVVAAYDFDGNRRWLVRPGVFNSTHGFCSPPLLFEDLVIVNGDHDGDSYLVAMKRSTGETVWKIPAQAPHPQLLPADHPPDRRPDADGAFRGRVRGQLRSAQRQAALDHRGSDRAVRGIAGLQREVVLHDRRLSDLPPPGHPARRTGRRDQDPRRLADHQRLRVRAVADSRRRRANTCWSSPTAGIASCFEAQTGERHWQERIGPHFSASPVEAEGRVFFLSNRGVTTIIRAGPEFSVVSKNELGEECCASPAMSHGRIYIRGETHLYCIGNGR